MVILGVGAFLMSEVPLYSGRAPHPLEWVCIKELFEIHNI